MTLSKLRIMARSKSKKVFIGVAWPYVNGELHVGHLAGYLLPADIASRYHRLIGNDVLMVSGSDCYGTPITVEADKKRTSPKEVADIYHELTRRLLTETLGITYDLYTRTDTASHQKTVQDFFLSLAEHGYIFIDTQEQFFSLTEERFLPDRYVEGECPHCHFLDARSDQCDKCGKLLEQHELIDPKSKITGSAVVLKPTEHYFVDWEKLQPVVDSFVEQNGSRWKSWVLLETKGWLRRGLKARAITRDIDWGVEIPVEQLPALLQIKDASKKRIYVWFEAVIGYLSASKLWSEQSKVPWQPFWYPSNEDEVEHVYFMGKDNLPFHTLFWPGTLGAYDASIHLPDVVSVNMYLDYEGKKFSKSRGVVVKIEDIIQKYGNDPVRFYLAKIMPETKDASFSWRDFFEVNNAILVGNVGNFIHRTLSIAQQADISAVSPLPLNDTVVRTISTTFTEARKSLDQYQFKAYLEVVLKLSTFGNQYVNNVKLWELKKTDQVQFYTALKNLYAVIIALGYLLAPLLPLSSEKLFALLKIDCPTMWPNQDDEINAIERLISEIDSSSVIAPLFTQIQEE